MAWSNLLLFPLPQVMGGIENSIDKLFPGALSTPESREPVQSSGMIGDNGTNNRSPIVDTTSNIKNTVFWLAIIVLTGFAFYFLSPFRKRG